MASGAVWGRTNEIGAVFHRIAEVSFGPQPTACGRSVVVASAFQCDRRGGEDAEPVIGEVCPLCRRVGVDRG